MESLPGSVSSCVSVKLGSEPGPAWLESTCSLQPGVSVRLFKGPVHPRPWARVLQTSTCFLGLGSSVQWSLLPKIASDYGCDFFSGNFLRPHESVSCGVFPHEH